MWTYEKALTVVAAYVRAVTNDQGVVMEAQTLDLPYGWVFFYQNRQYLDTGEMESLFGGNAPIIFNRVFGDYRVTGTAHGVERYLREYEATLPAVHLQLKPQLRHQAKAPHAATESPEAPEHGLSKSLWSESDFDLMGWHDACLYGFMVHSEAFELVMDIDYITRWLQPVPPQTSFNFYVAPATLVFREAHNMKASVELKELTDIQILDIRREASTSVGCWRWHVELNCGEVEFDAAGFTQYFRRCPTPQASQVLGLDARGGVSYRRQSFDMNG